MYDLSDGCCWLSKSYSTYIVHESVFPQCKLQLYILLARYMCCTVYAFRQIGDANQYSRSRSTLRIENLFHTMPPHYADLGVIL